MVFIFFPMHFSMFFDPLGRPTIMTGITVFKGIIDDICLVLFVKVISDFLLFLIDEGVNYLNYYINSRILLKI